MLPQGVQDVARAEAQHPVPGARRGRRRPERELNVALAGEGEVLLAERRLL